MTERRIRSARHHCPEVPTTSLNLRDTNRIYARVQTVEQTACHPPADPIAVQPQGAQLPHRDHAVLPCGQPGDRRACCRWGISVAISATPMPHLARVAPGALREGEVCDGYVTSRAARAGAGGRRAAGGPALPHGGRAVRRSGAGAYTRNGMISRATMFATLIIGLIAGPAVSL